MKKLKKVTVIIELKKPVTMTHYYCEGNEEAEEMTIWPIIIDQLTQLVVCIEEKFGNCITGPY